eukprot:CAMPEP_0172508044 /NCGR_PEP_ID=MMETSP1066-20121228/208804_1 /TAXON_ID=671091 /ORGANISM="Coscinodiscus wailesii, Strain CCMP2513" /LENGTH=69 /DNA_ID=CAMNT_0013285849 /DNA_START=86 /DNA_END=291 /DNA_ORIENTATION=+
MTALGLRKNNAIGTIPKEISLLSSTLTTLSFTHNALHGTIPTIITHLSKLRYLFLNKNHLTGTIPATLS